jgi:hypothetical protein
MTYAEASHQYPVRVLGNWRHVKQDPQSAALALTSRVILDFDHDASGRLDNSMTLVIW